MNNNLQKFALKNIFKNSISRFIIIYMLAGVCLIIVIGNVFLFLTQQTVEQKISESELKVLSEAGDKINLILNELRDVSDSIYTNRDIQQVLEGTYDTLMLENRINDFFIDLRVSYSGMINEIYVFNLQGYSIRYSTRSTPPGYITLDMLKKQDFYDNIMKKDGKVHLINGSSTTIPSEQEKYMLVRMLPNTSYSKVNGILIITFAKSSMLSPFNILPESNTNLYIADDNGNLVTGSEDNLDVTSIVKRIDGKVKGYFAPSGDFKDKFILYHRVKYSNLYLIQSITTESLFGFKRGIQQMLFLFVGIVILVSIVFYLYVIFRIYKPINKLMLSMSSVERGNFNIMDLDMERDDEIGMINRGFVSMVKNLDNLFLRIKTEQKEKRKAEIQMLQAQINPHFLYNTLSTIRCMVDMEKKQQVHDIIIALIKLLKNTLRFHDRFITVEEEINTLKAYLFIQNCRYNNFSVEYNVSPDAFKCRIPRLLLQPIVENSIVHGFRDMESGGKINISIVNDENILHISVSDNGCGISQKKLSKILPDLNTRTEQSIGMKNVHQRIQLLYGTKHGLKIRPIDTGGVAVELTIPYEEGL